MAESSADLQNQLNSFQDYCSIWKLKVNTDKSKVMVFSRGKLPRNLNFSLNGEKLEIVNSLNYLGHQHIKLQKVSDIYQVGFQFH
jgi:hypothetical protein